MNSYDALKMLDDVADGLAASQGRQRRYRADQFLTFMHARGWRMVQGEPIAPTPEVPEGGDAEGATGGPFQLQGHGA